MNRYLLNISYIGTHFRGAQRQIKFNDAVREDATTIQGRIEMGLMGLNPANEISVVTSSRTDSGVHALHSTMHVDLERRNGEPYTTRHITLELNKFFNYHNLPVRVHSTFLVPNTFHCRHAQSRTYMYRLIISKSESLNENGNLRHLPIEEYQRALVKCTSNFDVEKVKEVSRLFLGLHDFRTFMAKGSHTPDKITRRVMQRMDIEEAPDCSYTSYSWPESTPSDKEDYKFYNIYMQSSGFLYKQVRRTVAALIAAAQGVVTCRDVKLMLEVPSHHSWDPRLKTVSAHGLYLCRVTYPREITESFKTIW